MYNIPTNRKRSEYLCITSQPIGRGLIYLVYLTSQPIGRPLIVTLMTSAASYRNSDQTSLVSAPYLNGEAPKTTARHLSDLWRTCCPTNSRLYLSSLIPTFHLQYSEPSILYILCTLHQLSLHFWLDATKLHLDCLCTSM